MQSKRRAALGALAVRFLEPIQCDRAFVAVSGVDAAAGLTVVDFDAAEVKRKMLEKGKQAVVVADSSKIGQVAFACVAPLSCVHLLLTDSGIAAEDRTALESAGLTVQCVPICLQ